MIELSTDTIKMLSSVSDSLRTTAQITGVCFVIFTSVAKLVEYLVKVRLMSVLSGLLVGWKTEDRPLPFPCGLQLLTETTSVITALLWPLAMSVFLFSRYACVGQTECRLSLLPIVVPAAIYTGAAVALIAAHLSIEKKIISMQRNLIAMDTERTEEEKATGSLARWDLSDQRFKFLFGYSRITHKNMKIVFISFLFMALSAAGFIIWILIR